MWKTTVTTVPIIIQIAHLFFYLLPYNSEDFIENEKNEGASGGKQQAEGKLEGVESHVDVACKAVDSRKARDNEPAGTKRSNHRNTGQNKSHSNHHDVDVYEITISLQELGTKWEIDREEDHNDMAAPEDCL